MALIIRLKGRPESAAVYAGWYKPPYTSLITNKKTGKQSIRFTLHGGSQKWWISASLFVSFWIIYTYFLGDRSLLDTRRVSAEMFLAVALSIVACCVYGWKVFIQLFTKIDVYPDRLVKRYIRYQSKPYYFASLTGFDPVRKPPKSRNEHCVADGITLYFQGKKPITIHARMCGYKDLLERLAETNSEIQKILPISYETAKHHIER